MLKFMKFIEKELKKRIKGAWRGGVKGDGGAMENRIETIVSNIQVLIPEPFNVLSYVQKLKRPSIYG